MSVRYRVYSQLAEDLSPNMVTLPNSHDPEILDSDREIHLGSGFHSIPQVTQIILISDWLNLSISSDIGQAIGSGAN